MTKVYSAEWRLNVSKGRRANPIPIAKRARYWLGKTHNDEYKKRMSKALSGKKNPRYGIKLDDDFKKRLSDSVKAFYEKNGTDHLKKPKANPNFKYGEQNHNWKGGKPKCVDCGIEIGYGSERCYSCNRKGERSSFWKNSWNKGKTGIYSKETLKKMSIGMKIRWEDKSYRERIIKASLKGMLKRPTSLEQQMIAIIKKYNLPYKYTGNGSFLVGYKNPDFVNINGEKKLIEVGNTYHHDKNYARNRSNFFKQYGWKTVVFITQQLDESKVLKRLEGF